MVRPQSGQVKGVDFFDSIWKNNSGLMVSCHKFRRVSIVWMLWLVGCGCCGIGVVFPPFGQKMFRPFLVSCH